MQIYTKGILKSEEQGRKRSKGIAIISALFWPSVARGSAHFLALKYLSFYYRVSNKEGDLQKCLLVVDYNKYIEKCSLTVPVFIFLF